MYFRNLGLKVVKYDFKKTVALKTREKNYGELLTLKSLQTKKESAMKSCLNHKRGT